MKRIAPAIRRSVREAYDGPLSAPQLADLLQISTASVNRIWNDAKESGLIEDRPRRQFVQHCGGVAEIEADDVPVPPGDPLLAALRAAHPSKDGLLENSPSVTALAVVRALARRHACEDHARDHRACEATPVARKDVTLDASR